MDKNKSKKIIDLMKKMQLKIEAAAAYVNKMEEEYNLLNQEVLELVTDQEAPSQQKKTPKKRVQQEYEYKGIVDYANRTVLRSTEDLAKDYTFAELCSIVDQQKIYPTKWAKLKLYAKESDVTSLRKDPARRYFMKDPVVSKDGVKFYVTTQWTTRQWNKKKAQEEEGTFERYRKAVAKVGILINRIDPQ